VPATVQAATPAREQSALRSELVFLLQASRPGFWLTALWFYMLPLAQRQVFDSASFWLGAMYVTFPMGMLLYGWNDCVDYATDHHNPRKGTFLFGARGTAEQLRKLPLRIVLVQLPFAVALTWLAGGKMLLCLAGMVAAAAIYNWPRYGFKAQPPFEIVNQAGYLFVFVLSSWLNNVPQLPWAAMLFGALFAMHSHVFGEVMDLEPDRAARRRTTTTVVGRIPAKLLIAAFLGIEAAVVGVFFKQWALLGLLLASAGWFVLDARCFGATDPTQHRKCASPCWRGTPWR
jgi:4-hydroxybenzoate polyprenyltransferase